MEDCQATLLKFGICEGNIADFVIANCSVFCHHPTIHTFTSQYDMK